MNNNDLINQIFQQYLGRAPSAAELQGYSSAISAGSLTPISLMQFIQSSPEYQQAQIPQLAQQYYNQANSLTNQYSSNELGQAYQQAQGQLAGQGRPDSSALGAQFAQAGQNVTSQNSEFLAQGLQGYLGGAYGGLTSTGQQVGAQAGAQGALGYQSYLNQSNLNQQQAQYYQQFLNQNLAQAQRNNYFQLGGSLIGAGGAAAGGYLSGL